MIKAILILEAKGGAPEWFCVLPMGEVKLADSRESFQVTPEALQAVVSAWKNRGNDLVIDYEHQTMTGMEAPAAGWIKELDPRDDGLWAKVEWTDKALKYIENKEYRYFSPVVELGEGRVVQGLLHAALTNFPAIANLSPLAARTLAVEMPDAGGSMSIEELRAQLGAEIEQLKGELESWRKLGLGETLDQARGAVLALTETRTRLEAVQGELQALKADQARKQAEDAVEAALQAGKLTPAQREWALKYAGESPEGFRSYVEQAPKVVPLKEKLPETKQDQEGVLSAEELAVCKAMGIDSKQFAATKKQLADDKRGE